MQEKHHLHIYEMLHWMGMPQVIADVIDMSDKTLMKCEMIYILNL